MWAGGIGGLGGQKAGRLGQFRDWLLRTLDRGHQGWEGPGGGMARQD